MFHLPVFAHSIREQHTSCRKSRPLHAPGAWTVHRTRGLRKLVLSLLVTLAVTPLTAPSVFAQTQQLRGLPSDPRSNLPSPSQQLRSLQSQQLKSLSARQKAAEAQRRQDHLRMNQTPAGCAANPAAPGCNTDRPDYTGAKPQ